MAGRAVGIDLGASCAWYVVADQVANGRWQVVGGSCLAADNLDELAPVCAGATVAIDAPPAPSEGRHVDDDRVATKFRLARCAEVGLRLAGHAVSWVTPVRGAPVARWMQVGFDVWRVAGAAPADEVLEVYPHAVFRELAGRSLPSKQTSVGRHARLEALRACLLLPDGAELWGHDAIDAGGAAVVAAQRIDGRARPATCGWHEHAPMWLPELLRDTRG